MVKRGVTIPRLQFSAFANAYQKNLAGEAGRKSEKREKIYRNLLKKRKKYGKIIQTERKTEEKERNYESIVGKR